jgi:hypothetical protein
MLSAYVLSFANNTSNLNNTLTSKAPAVSILYSGIESFLFPFLLVFAITYGVLERSNMFKGKSDINAIIAFVLGIVFATTNYTLKLTFLILPIAGIIAVVIFMLLILASMAYGGSDASLPSSIKKIITVLAVVISLGLVIWVLTSANLTFAGISSKAVSSNLTSYLPYIIVFVFLVLAGYLLSK